MSVIVSKYRSVKLLSENLISFYYEGLSPLSKKVLICEFKRAYLNPTIIKQLIRDSEKLERISHANLLKLVDFQYDGKSFYSVYDYPKSFVTLDSFLKTERRTNLRLLWKIISQIIRALSELEKYHVIHGNLNLNSILIDEDNRVVLFKTLLPMRIFSKVLSQFSVIEHCIFYSPEFIQNQHYTKESDIYSFGVLLYVLFGHGWPYPYSDHVHRLKKALLNDIIPFKPLSEEIPKKLDRIISICMRRDPGQRFESFSELMTQYKTDVFEQYNYDGTSSVEESLKKDLKHSVLKRFRSITRFVVFILFSSLILVGTYFVYLWYLTAIPNIVVPNVIGLTIEKAEVLLSKHGLKNVISGEWVHAYYPEGVIVDTKPGKGRVVKANRIIRLFISKGVTGTHMPELVGRTIEQSMALLSNYGVVNNFNIEDKHYSLQYQEGVVLSQLPSANYVLQPSENVYVVISKGFPVHVYISNGSSLVIDQSRNLRLVTVEFSVLPDWSQQEVSIVYHYNTTTEIIYNDFHEAGETVSLDFELEKGGYIEVFYNDQLALKQDMTHLNKKTLPKGDSTAPI